MGLNSLWKSSTNRKWKQRGREEVCGKPYFESTDLQGVPGEHVHRRGAQDPRRVGRADGDRPEKKR